MAGEAQVAANRRSAQDSPQRHRAGPQFVNEAGVGFILRALCASMVKNRRNKPNSKEFQVGGVKCQVSQARRRVLRVFPLRTSHFKLPTCETNPIPGSRGPSLPTRSGRPSPPNKANRRAKGRLPRRHAQREPIVRNEPNFIWTRKRASPQCQTNPISGREGPFHADTAKAGLSLKQTQFPGSRGILDPDTVRGPPAVPNKANFMTREG